MPYSLLLQRSRIGTILALICLLAGLVTALYAQNNDPFLVATCSSYINKKAGESLEKRVGLYFNASDLVQEIPKTMKSLVGSVVVTRM